jgi:hypothetical protein
MLWDIPPSNVLEVRHRTYTEAEQRFLDYCDIQLKDQQISNFSLKCIDYGNVKHKFDFRICHMDPLRQSVWNEIDGLNDETSISLCATDVVPHRGEELKRKRGKNEVKTPFLGFNELESHKLSTEQLATKLNRERNFDYASDDFKQWYKSIINFMDYVPQKANNLGWLVQDEYIYPNSVAFVAPSKPVVLKETLRKDISKLEKELDKAKDTIEKLRSRLNEKSSKKSKVDGRDGKTIEVLAVEKANGMYNSWLSDDEGRYKEQIRSLQESHARHTERIEKLQKELAEEKTKCAGLEKDASHKTQLHKLEVDNLDKRLKAAERREEQLQTAFFPRLSSMSLSRRGEMTSVNQFTPESLHDENGHKRRIPPGAGESP